MNTGSSSSWTLRGNMGYNKDLVYTHMEYTYVYFEMKTGYFESSSFRLAIEMVIERGVDDDADEIPWSISTMPTPSKGIMCTNADGA